MVFCSNAIAHYDSNAFQGAHFTALKPGLYISISEDVLVKMFFVYCSPFSTGFSVQTFHGGSAYH